MVIGIFHGFLGMFGWSWERHKVAVGTFLGSLGLFWWSWGNHRVLTGRLRGRFSGKKSYLASFYPNIYMSQSVSREWALRYMDLNTYNYIASICMIISEK